MESTLEHWRFIPPAAAFFTSLVQYQNLHARAKQERFGMSSEREQEDIALPNRPELQLVIELEALEGAFRDGCKAFLSDLKAEQARFEKAVERAQELLWWGIGSMMSDEEVDAHLAARRTKQQ